MMCHLSLADLVRRCSESSRGAVDRHNCIRFLLKHFADEEIVRYSPWDFGGYDNVRALWQRELSDV